MNLWPSFSLLFLGDQNKSKSSKDVGFSLLFGIREFFWLTNADICFIAYLAFSLAQVYLYIYIKEMFGISLDVIENH